MSIGRLAEGTRALVIHAEQCHPKGDIDWWDYKRRHFGAGDGIEFIEAERLIPLFTTTWVTRTSMCSSPRPKSRSRRSPADFPKPAVPIARPDLFGRRFAHAFTQGEDFPMSNDEPFTLDLFGITALSCGPAVRPHCLLK
jgi:hypothetical protein